MGSSIFIFSRVLSVEPDHYLRQTVSVIAPDEQAAKRVLDRDLQLKREAAAEDEPALRDEPSWRVDAVDLDEPKVITFAIT